MAGNKTKRVYERNYITNVLFRIDFPLVLGLTEKSPPSKYQEEIATKFPRLNENIGGQIEFQLPDGDIKRKEIISWEFVTKDKTKRVVITPEFAYFESKKYLNFDEFYEEIKFIFEPFLKLYPVTIVNRIGLRFINQIKIDQGNPFDWEHLIHESLYSVPKEFIQEKDKILRSMHSIELKENGHHLRIQFGLFNPEYPNPITRKEFILDYDCYEKEDVESGIIFEKATLFNGIIDEWFEQSIDDGLRSIMGERHE